MQYWFVLLVSGAAIAAPLHGNDTQWNSISENNSPLDSPVGKLAFSLADKESIQDGNNVPENKGGFMQIVQDVVANPLLKGLLSFVEKFTENSQQATAERPVVHAAQSVRAEAVPLGQAMPLNDEARHFEASLSHDDAPVRIDSRPIMHSDHGKITDQSWSKTLFGERGVLTEVFHLVDEQRRAAEANRPHAAPTQSDSSSKINGNFDLKKIFDSIFMGPRNGEFGDPGPELPEFLGICNRLSCGDIYKAIDQFRRSDFFSNFQTGLQLIQDPKGWEIIGKALENPELISEFANTAGLKEMMGSALGEDKDKEDANEKKKTEILPEDGDFGTDFTYLIDGTKPKNKPGNTLPEISFSIDENKEKTGGNGDYYTQVKTSPDEDVDHVDVDVDAGELIPASKTIEKSGTEELPGLSFSVDEEGESEGTESVAIEKSIDVVPPRKEGVIDVTRPSKVSTSRRMASSLPPSTRPTTIRTTTRSTTTTTRAPTTTRRNFRKDNDYYAMYYDNERA